MDFAFQSQPDPEDSAGDGAASEPLSEAGEAVNEASLDRYPLTMRPVTSPAAIELARRLLDSGAPGVELRPDGTLWALGVDRRHRDRQDS
jgi:hypothetical protein